MSVITTEDLRAALALSEERDKLDAEIVAERVKFDEKMAAKVARLAELNREINYKARSNGDAGRRKRTGTPVKPSGNRSTINRDEIVALIASKGEPVAASDIREHVGISPATLSNVLGELVSDGKLVKTGVKRGTRYVAA